VSNANFFDRYASRCFGPAIRDILDVGNCSDTEMLAVGSCRRFDLNADPIRVKFAKA